MDIFIIHSGSKHDEIKQRATDLEQISTIKASFLGQTAHKKWKSLAKTKIKQSDIILYFVCDDSCKSENIKKEIKLAKRYAKPIFYVKYNDDYELTNFAHRNKLISYSKFMEELKNYLDNGYVREKLFNENHDQDAKILLDQYKLLLETSETAVSRRQATTTLYTAINAILIPLISGLMFSNIAIAFYVNTSLCIVGIILCFTWLKTIETYGHLNYSKFKVINEIEKKLSASVFDAEWAARNSSFEGKKIKSFTELEKIFPKIFRIVYAALFASSLIYFIYSLLGA